jgi:hypothetical protein
MTVVVVYLETVPMRPCNLPAVISASLMPSSLRRKRRRSTLRESRLPNGTGYFQATESSWSRLPRDDALHVATSHQHPSKADPFVQPRCTTSN